MKVVIIGGGAGGISTASNIRKLDKNIEITVLTRDEHVAYSPCAIPYVLSGTIESFDDIIMKRPEDYKEKNINIITKVEVTAVNHDNKNITYIQDGKELNMDYDKIVLATGGNPFIPPMEGSNLEGVFKIRNIEDGRNLQNWIKDAKNIIVTGAGLIGIEIACGLQKLGLNVILNEMMPQIVPRSLDQDMSDILCKYIESQGVKIILGQPVKKIVGEEKVEKVLIGNEEYDADAVILATGVRPELELAKMIGCNIGRWAILTNAKMETSVPDVYAVGDCVESIDLVLGTNTISHLGTTAVRQSKALARTITGRISKFNPVLNAMVSKVGNLEFGAVGLTSVSSQQNNITPVVVKVSAYTRARYYPNAKPMDVKVICDSEGKIIGCQIIAAERVAERIDTMTLAITEGLTCFDLANMEFAYAPPVSMVTDPLILAVEEVIKKFN